MDTITIVSDPGVDDLVALLLLNKLSKESRHTLISTFGNVKEELTSTNAKEFIAFVANKWKFMHGSKKPLKPLWRPYADYFHGPDGVWNIHPNISIEKVEEVLKFPKNKSVISLGPMTDVHKLLQKEKFSEITIMGGAFNFKGNETEFSEYNIALDPEASSMFFEKCQEIDVKVVPLDVTEKVFWTKEKVKSIPENSKVNIWIKNLLLAWFENYNKGKEKKFTLHDPLAVYLHFFPKHVNWKKEGVKTITDGIKRGKTNFDNNNPACKVAIDIINSDEVAEKIFNTLF